MKRLLQFIGILLLCAAAAHADSNTARMGMTKPAIGSVGWGTKINTDMDIIDSTAASQFQSNTFIAGTTQQILGVLIATNPANNITFSSITLTGGSVGSVLFLNTSSGIAGNGSQFFWNNTSNRLGIGTNSPVGPLDVLSSSNTDSYIARFGNSGSSYVVAVATTGNVYVGTNTAVPANGGYGTILGIGSLANSPGIILQRSGARWGVRGGASDIDITEEVSGNTLATFAGSLISFNTSAFSVNGTFSESGSSSSLNGNVYAGTTTVPTMTLEVLDGGQFGMPRASAIRGTIVPGREGAQVYDLIAHGVCTATGTVTTSWIAGNTGSTPCAH